TIGATLAILFILTFLVVPIALAGTYAINELREWVTWAIETNRHGAVTPGWIATMPVIGEWLNGQWTSYLGHPGGIGEVIQAVSGSNIGNIYRGALAAGGSAFSLLLTLLFMMIALF
ncbi:MAG: AI-2E family transporter, partial [Mesorhizobium sp.]